MTASHGLGPLATEIENGDFATISTVSGSNTYIQQGDSLIVLDPNTAAALGRVLLSNACRHERMAAMPTVGQMSCVSCHWQRAMTPEEFARWNPPFK